MPTSRSSLRPHRYFLLHCNRMVVLLNSVRLSPSISPSFHSTFHKKNRSRWWSSSSATMSSSDQSGTGSKGSLSMDFPYLSPPHQILISDLLSSMDARLGHQLLPSTVPPDVLCFQNQSGTSRGALNVVSGSPDSPVDFILESWLHCELPFGVLDITTLFAFLNGDATDAPHLLMEFIQNGPTSLVLLMDLLPRKDPVLYPDYLQRFYQETQLDKHRQELQNLPTVKPYVSPSLYIRSVLSPTAVAVNIKCGSAEGEGGMEEMMGVHVGGAARGMMVTWLEKCAGGGGGDEVSEGERVELRRRDGLVKSKAIEIDLTANLPRLFGQDVADRVVGVIQKAFGV